MDRDFIFELAIIAIIVALGSISFPFAYVMIAVVAFRISIDLFIQYMEEKKNTAAMFFHATIVIFVLYTMVHFMM